MRFEYKKKGWEINSYPFSFYPVYILDPFLLVTFLLVAFFWLLFYLVLKAFIKRGPIVLEEEDLYILVLYWDQNIRKIFDKNKCYGKKIEEKLEFYSVPPHITYLEVFMVILSETFVGKIRKKTDIVKYGDISNI